MTAPARSDVPLTIATRTTFVVTIACAAVLGTIGMAYVRHRAGSGAPLDDAYIHVQYARTIAEGHAFRYGWPDEPRTSGATSLLHVGWLALAWRLGLDADGVVTFAQCTGVLAWALAVLGSVRLGTAL